MASVLANKSGRGFPVRGPVLGLFLDLEVRMVNGPIFADHDYALRRKVVGLSQSKRTESYWTETTITDPESRRPRRHRAVAPGRVQGVLRRLPQGPPWRQLTVALDHLRRCLELARTARDGGNEPFGSLLVGATAPCSPS